MKRASPRRVPAQAFALVLVLFILSLLTVVTVGFLSSMAAEQVSSSANANKASADLAAQSGVDSAIAVLRTAFQAYPDSATVWDGTQSANDDGTYNEGPSLYLRAASRTDGSGNTVPAPNGGNAPTAQPDSRRTFVLPLVSGVPGGNARLVSQKAGVLPVMKTAETDASNPLAFEQTFTDLNVRRFKGDNQGAIGSPPTWADTVPKPARAFWVNVTSDTQHTPTNPADDPVTSRYAFWIDDESFRANLDYANEDPATGRKDNTTQQLMQCADASLLGTLGAIPPNPAAQTLSTSNAVALAGDSQIRQTRAQYPGALFLEPGGFQHGFGTGSVYPSYPDLDGDAQNICARYMDQLRYLTTTTSSSLNLTRHGTQRLNLNDAVTLGGASFTDPTQKLQRQIDQIVGFLAFHAPDFGQRFYRQNLDTTSARINSAQDVIAAHTPIYFYKTAANLHDYIDADAQPTIIKAGGQVLSIGVPSPLAPYVAADGPNPMWAMGKDSAPFVQEIVVRFRPVFSKSSKTYDLRIDYYIEFWNMTNKDVYAGNVPAGATGISLGGAKIHISNQQSWLDKGTGTYLTVSDGGSRPVTGDDDFDIDLVNGVQSGSPAGVPQPGGVGVLFSAGTATVITTDPDCATFQALGYNLAANPDAGKSLTGVPNPNTTYYCPQLIGPGRREYKGPVTINGTSYGIYPVVGRDGGNTGDYQTEMTLYNAKGYLEFSAFALPEAGYAVVTTTDPGTAPNTAGTENDYAYGGGMLSNQHAASQLDDARTNNEQITIQRICLEDSASEPDQTRYFNYNHTLGYPYGNAMVPNITAGSAAFPWPDYFGMPVPKNTNGDKTNAPMVVADGPLTSIGQLGDVFDPARVPGGVGTLGIGGSRGGGRTIRLGQPDDRYNCDPSGNSGTGSNAAMNTPDNIPASTSWAAWRLADLFSIDDNMEQPARVNINGVGRDGGAALRTLLTGYKFQPVTGTDPGIHGDQSLGGQNLASDLSRVVLNRANPGFKGPGDAAAATGVPYGVQRLVGAMLNRLNPASSSVLPRPFFERGEMGEVGSVSNGQVTNSIFGLNGATTTATNTDLCQGADMNVSFDHGREELFRRVAEQICTRGDVFTVYTVGQSITQKPPNPSGATDLEKNPPKRVLATQRLRVTFRLRPKDKDGNPFHPGYTLNGATPTYVDFVPATNPLSADPNNSRYARPACFDVEVLHVSSF